MMAENLLIGQYIQKEAMLPVFLLNMKYRATMNTMRQQERPAVLKTSKFMKMLILSQVTKQAKM